MQEGDLANDWSLERGCWRDNDGIGSFRMSASLSREDESWGPWIKAERGQGRGTFRALPWLECRWCGRQQTGSKWVTSRRASGRRGSCSHQGATGWELESGGPLLLRTGFPWESQPVFLGGRLQEPLCHVGDPGWRLIKVHPAARRCDVWEGREHFIDTVPRL